MQEAEKVAICRFVMRSKQYLAAAKKARHRHRSVVGKDACATGTDAQEHAPASEPSVPEPAEAVRKSA